MEEKHPLPHALTRIASPKKNLDLYLQLISADRPLCLKLAQPLFEAGLWAAGITQRSNYTSGEHISNVYRFTILLRGKMMIKLGELEQELTPGQLACCTPGTLFNRSAQDETWWIYLDFNQHAIWQPLKEHGSYIRNHDCPDLTFILLQNLLDLSLAFDGGVYGDYPTIEQKTSSFEGCIQQGLQYSRMLLSIIQQECILLSNGLDDRTKRLHTLVKEIKLAPHHDWTMESMSRFIHTSKRTLARLMMSEYNMSSAQFVIQTRIDEACRLLQNKNNSITSVALHVGYKSVYSFSRIFTKHMGMAPGKYRSIRQ